jgi:hypothetical protein
MRLSYMPINSYVIMAGSDFFAHWLLGSLDTDADILELQQATPATNSRSSIHLSFPL